MARMNEQLLADLTFELCVSYISMNNVEHQSYLDRVCEGNDTSRSKHLDP